MIGLLMGTVFFFGVTSALPRSYFDYENEEDRSSVLSTALIMILVGALTQTVIGLVFSDYISIYFFKIPNYSNELRIMILSSAIGFVNTFFQSYFRLLSKSMTVVVQGLVASAVNFFTAILLFKLTNLTILVPILSYLFSQIVIFIYSIFISSKKLKIVFNFKEANLIARFGVPTVIVSFTMMAFEWSDRFFLNKFLTLNEVGSYSFSYKFGTLITPLLIAPFAQIWTALMMKYKDSEDIKNLTTQVFTIYFAVGAFFCLGACSYIDELIYLFIKNKDYHESIFVIPFIMAAALAHGTNNITNAGFLYQRKVSEISNICIGFALLSVAASYFLIPWLGFLGAALSTLIIYLALSLVLLLRSLRYFSFKIEAKKILFFIILNFGIIAFNYSVKIDSMLLRLSLKTFFILLSLSLTVVVLVERKHLRLLKNPKALFQLMLKTESV